MKNLRKVLALVLVVAMMASLVISASALSAKDYTDYSEVVNKDAVAMLTELGIINGYPTGDFQPAGVVTRAEMAKMIYVVLNSGNDQAPTPDAQRYSDVYKGHWAEGYVAFCDDLGIIDGMGDGTFAPSAPVTGVQAAKMLLVAMGYDSAVEGFTGTNWDYGVLKAASAAGLFEGFTASVNEGCTRDNAALLVYNALIGDCVSYVGNTAVATGDTLIGTYYGLVAVTGVVVANEYANLFGVEPLLAGKTEIAFIGDQYSDLDHAIDPVVDDWSVVIPGIDHAYDHVADYKDWTAEYVEELYENGGFEANIDFADWLEVKEGVNDADEYDSYVFSVETSLAQIGTTVTVYAKLKGNYEQFTNIVEYAKYDMFSGKTVGNVVADDDCVVFYNEGAAYEWDGEFKVDYNTRYFENYQAVWAEVDGGRVYPYDEEQPGASAAPDLTFYFDEMLEAVRGEYLWAVDVDGDGIVEIVLKYRQVFAVAEYDEFDDEWTLDGDVVAVEDRGDYTFDRGEQNGFNVVWEGIPSEDIVFDGEELKDGMKVLVVPVDGKFYVKEAASVMGAVEELNYNTDKEYYAVVGGTKYYESGLYWADDVFNADWFKGPTTEKNFYYQIPEQMEVETEYNLYLDDFGNVVAFEKAGGPPPMKEYFLVTGAAREVQSLAVTESIVFGGRPSKELSIGIGAYYGGRGTRNNTLDATVEVLFQGGAQSLDANQAAYIGVSTLAANWQYVNYENVLRVKNIYNLENNAMPGEDPNYVAVDNPNMDDIGRYGWRTTLVKAAFSEEGVISDLEGQKITIFDLTEMPTEDANGKPIDTIKGDIIVGGEFTDNAGNPYTQKMYIGDNTLVYIYMYDDTTGEQNLITLTGSRDLPELPIANRGANGNYGVVNAYYVEANPDMKMYDEDVVVFELNVDFSEGKGLPTTRLNNWVWVYDVTATYGNSCQEVKAIDGRGELVTLYYDYYYYGNKLDKDATGWYVYVASPDADCAKHDNHVILMPKGTKAIKDFYKVYAVSADPDVKEVAGIDDMTFNYKQLVQVWEMNPETNTMEANYIKVQQGPDMVPGYFDLAKVPVIITDKDIDGDYNGNEVIVTNYETLVNSEYAGFIDGVIASEDGDDDGEDGDYDRVYVLSTPDGTIIAFIVIQDDLANMYNVERMAYYLAVKESEVEAAPGEPMPAM